MGNKIKISDIKNSQQLKVLLLMLVIIAYLALAAYSYYWFAVIANYSPGADFKIYWLAYLNAIDNDSPYWPYEIGRTFLYHPFALSFMSPLSMLQKYRTIGMTWIFLSMLAFAGAVYVTLQIAKDFFPGRKNFKIAGVNPVFITIIAVLAFVPMWETFLFGQINAFVYLFIVLSLKDHLEDRPWRSGLWLAFAILLKTSPIIMLGYFAARLRWKEVASSILSLLIGTILATMQFSPKILRHFLQILPGISNGIHVSINNYSPLIISHRIVEYFSMSINNETLVFVNKGILALFLALILGVTFWKTWRGHEANNWLFVALWAVIVFFSPLVWLHHGLFLTLPLVLFLNYNRTTFYLGGVVMFAFQFTRLLQVKAILVGVTPFTGGLIVVCMSLWLGLRPQVNPQIRASSLDVSKV